jgi:hypothetical protein
MTSIFKIHSIFNGVYIYFLLICEPLIFTHWRLVLLTLFCLFKTLLYFYFKGSTTMKVYILLPFECNSI